MSQPLLPKGIGVLTFGKFMGNVAFRMVFPFLPTIARGLGVSLSTMGTALAIRNVSSLTAPLIGRIVDSLAYRRVMASALVGLAISVLLAGVSSGIVLFTIAVTLTQLMKSLFDTAAGSWLGLHVPFARRGRVVGLTETAWALAFLLGMPIMALIIRAGTWRTGFIVLAAGLILTALFVARSLPQRTFDAPAMARGGWAPPRQMIPGMAAALVFAVGHQIMLVTFAAWLEAAHDVSVSGLGMAALALGGAELFSSVAGIRFIDRLGKVDGFRLAALATIPPALMLPLGDANLALAVALLALLFVGFEYAFISGVALFTELDPVSRGQSISWGIAAFSVGHAAGSIAGPRLFDSGEMVSVGLAVAVLSATSGGILFFMVGEPQT